MRTLLIFSGGMDSATLLYDLLAAGDDVECLSVDYKQRHNRELESAAKICRRLRVNLDCLDLRSLGMLLSGSSQTDMSVPVPFGKYDEPSMKQTVVPNRNMFMLAAAGAVAISRGMSRLAYGAHAGDHTIYPDCRPDFVKAMRTAFGLCDWSHLDLYAPYLNWSKGEICRRGLELGVPYEHTWTCYSGDKEPCHQCGSCTERAEAFEFAGDKDPLLCK